MNGIGLSPECKHCQRVLPIEKLEEPGVVIQKYNRIFPPGDYYNLQIITTLQCQYCKENNYILWDAKKMTGKIEEMREQDEEKK